MDAASVLETVYGGIIMHLMLVRSHTNGHSES